ncbi:RNA ligase family protein, partial [Methanobrevibacter sp.]|uniref:ATP-dependent DNA ligase n=1 Tax=Methanobrevibacter sp. TaxID=66852 RepID=UPI00386366C6
MLAKRLLMSIEDEQVRNMVQGIMVKDLKLGVNVTTLNKVFGKDFIPTFEVQLAESYAKQKEGSLKNKEVWITQKYDGTRIIYNPLIKQFTTRNGKPYEGLEHLTEECDILCNSLKDILGLDDKVIIDGELVHKPIEGMNSRDLFALTSGIARKKGKVKEKKNLQFHVFDVVPFKEFQKGKSDIRYKARRNALDLAFCKNNFENVIHVPVLYNGIYDEKIITDLLKQMELMGNEGCMINLNDFYYCKRNKSLLKVKSFFDADVYVTDLIEGTGRNKNKLGAVEVKFLFNGKEESCKVGSGFTDEQREYYWKHKNEIINKVIVINYFEVSKNKENEISLRFPTFTGEIRFDKEEKDITDVEE